MTIQWPELFFIRHGQTDWNAEGRYQGARDIPLNVTGRAQADANGVLLRDLLARDTRDPREFAWYASPLDRTRETMLRVRRAFDPEPPTVTYDPRLIEISFGELEGCLHSELPPHIMAAPGERDAAFWSFRPEKGENYDDLMHRITDFARELTGPSVIVAHGGVLRMLRHLIEGAGRVEVINWFPPQDAVVHFNSGRMTVYPATSNRDD